MKTQLHIPQDAVVFVGDGRKALFLRNKGDEKFPNLVTEQVFVDENPSSHEQGTGAAGRAFHSAGSAARSAVETTDWHVLEEHRFARSVAEALEGLVRAQRIKESVIVAPPRTLADLRQAFHKDVSQRIVAELNKDLTKLPVDQIEQHLFG